LIGVAKVDDLAACRDGSLDPFVIRCVVQLDLNVEAGQEFQEQLIRAAVGILDRDDPVPR
jgi:hypothetical protein